MGPPVSRYNLGADELDSLSQVCSSYRMPFLLLLILSVLFAGSVSAAEEGCSVTTGGGLMRFPADVRHHLHVRQNGTCTFTLRSTTNQLGRPSDWFNIKSLKVEIRPKNGFAGTNGVIDYLYRPNPGYTGGDSFVILADGDSNSGSGVAKIVVDVSVTP